MSEFNSVQQFYAGKTIFITGGSGFMGKVLIEKLLFSCSEVKELLVLMRPKRGKNAMQRVEDFAKIPVFSRVMRDKPEMMKKISPMFGDISLPKLGLSEEQYKKVTEESQIVFHLAASLKLEATLKPNVLTNLTATHHVLQLAHQMKKLIQFVHLSTAFCCEDQDVLKEKVYDFHHRPEDLMRCAEWMTEEAMEAMQKEILGTQPNTYTYTKRLAEILVRDEYGKLPVSIVRPSIVSPAFKNPLPGWVDSLNGPPGILLAAGKGVLRSMLCNPDSIIEAIPVDACINGILVMTKYLATTERSKEIPVYNMTLHESRKITNGQMVKYSKQLGQKYPVYGGLWYPDGDITQNVLVHTLKTFFFQWLPAYFIDFWLMIFGQKRFMVHVQKKIAVGMEVLQFFTMRDWKFKSDNFESLANHISSEENQEHMFKFTTHDSGDEYEYLKVSLLGARQYCVKDPLSTLPKARLQLKIQYVVHVFCKFMFWYFVIRTLLKLSGYLEPVNNVIAFAWTSISGGGSSGDTSL